MTSVLYLGCPAAERADTERLLAAADVSVVWADSAACALRELQRHDMPMLLDFSRGAQALQAARDMRDPRFASRRRAGRSCASTTRPMTPNGSRRSSSAQRRARQPAAEDPGLSASAGTAACTRRAGIGLEDVLAHVRLGLGQGSLVFESRGTLRQARARFERDYIAAVLDQHRGRISDAAKALGIQRTNLYRKMRALRVDSRRP